MTTPLPANRRPVPPRDNPFRSACVDALGYVPPNGQTWEEIESRIRAANFRGALVGPHGHGKSTLMHRLAKLDVPCARESHDVIQVQADGSNLSDVKRALTIGPPRLFLDGYDLLPWRLRRKVSRRPQVIVTSHRETKLPTLFRCETTPRLLGEVIGHLSPVVKQALADDAMAALYSAHHGNIRNALRELYDRVASGEFQI